jgi:hypothetical protein
MMTKRSVTYTHLDLKGNEYQLCFCCAVTQATDLGKGEDVYAEGCSKFSDKLKCEACGMVIKDFIVVD